MPISTRLLNTFGDAPLVRCDSLRRCYICEDLITKGEMYRWLGDSRNAHESCRQKKVLELWAKKNTKEKTVQADLIYFLELHGWLVTTTDASRFTSNGMIHNSKIKPGTQDILAIRPSAREGGYKSLPPTFHVLAIECKRPSGGRVRVSQKIYHEYSLKFGVEVLVVKNLAEFEQFYWARFRV